MCIKIISVIQCKNPTGSIALRLSADALSYSIFAKSGNREFAKSSNREFAKSVNREFALKVINTLETIARRFRE